MLKKLKIIWRCLTISEKHIVKYLELVGPASSYLEDAEYLPATKEHKDSVNSAKLVIDRIEDNTVYYYSYFVDPEGVPFIQKHLRRVSMPLLIKQIRDFKLLVVK